MFDVAQRCSSRREQPTFDLSQDQGPDLMTILNEDVKKREHTLGSGHTSPQAEPSIGAKKYADKNCTCTRRVKGGSGRVQTTRVFSREVPGPWWNPTVYSSTFP